MNYLSSKENFKQRNRNRLKQEVISQERINKIMKSLIWDKNEEYRYISAEEKKDYALSVVLDNTNKITRILNRS